MDHYSRHLQFDALVERLRQAYPGGADARQLAPVDQLHTGGIQASLQLCQRLARLAPTRVLDIGSGAGGLMRLLQALPGCQVTGLDLSHGLNRLNRALAALHRTAGHPALVTGDARTLPFAAATFDTLVMQHSLLNMPDTGAVLLECHRVLANGGHLMLHELVQGPSDAPLHYPVPWADSASGSHLLDTPALALRLQQAGFESLEVTDLSAQALSWRSRQQAKERDPKRRTAAPVSPGLILGTDFHVRADNLLCNLAEGRVGVVEWLLRKPAG
ncbi:class I SAM-dependent methyltransferase [Marinobacterium aestuariivivens]|uniref:Class I SAM-dependent methyltransferase n=1 Tax=Marinobacterium aestuariivivens TaxID=1698799 RepID=A0ABW2A4R1_9GAMM